MIAGRMIANSERSYAVPASGTIGGVSFAMLGPLRAERDGTDLALGTPQQRTVLAVMLLRAGLLTTTDDLVDALWPEDPPETAVATVRTYLSRLRRTVSVPVGKPSVRISWLGGGYVLSLPQGALDVERFARHTALAAVARRRDDLATASAELRTALALRRGTPLAGLPGRYLAAHRLRLDEQCRDAALDLADVTIAQGSPADALPALRDLVADHPLAERAHGLLITALTRLGRRAEALDHYRQVGRALAAELGVEPGPELRVLHRRVLRGDSDVTRA